MTRFITTKGAPINQQCISSAADFAPYESLPESQPTASDAISSISGSYLQNTDIYQPQSSSFLALVWRYALVSDSSTTDLATDEDVARRHRVESCYRSHFGNDLSDISRVDTLLELLLENDRIQEAEDFVKLSLELAEHFCGSDSPAYWTAQGNLARVYYEQGRDNEAQAVIMDVIQKFENGGHYLSADMLTHQLTLVQILLSQGHQEEAKTLCVGVVQTARFLYSGSHEMSLQAEFQLARAYNELQEFNEAKKSLENIVAARTRQDNTGFTNTKTLQACIELSRTLSNLGNRTDALKLCLKIEDHFKRSTTIRPMWTLELVMSVGRHLYSLHQFVEAERVFRDLYDQTLARVRSRRHPKAVKANLLLASAMAAQNLEKEVVGICEESYNVTKEIYGPYHRRTLQLYSTLTWSQSKSIPFHDLETRVSKIRDLRKLYLGENDLDSLGSDMDCAQLGWQRGDWNGAFELLNQVRRKSKILSGFSTQLKMELTAHFANFYHAKADYDKAEIQQRKALNLVGSTVGMDHPVTASMLTNLAAILRRLERFEEAEALLSEGISRLSESVGRKHPAITHIHATRAELFGEQHQWKDAEILQRRCLSDFEAYGETHPYVISAKHRLADSFAHRGKFDEAEKLYISAIEASRITYSSNHRIVADILSGLAKLMRHQGNWKRAQDLCEEVKNIRVLSYGQLTPLRNEQLTTEIQHPDIIDALEALSRSYDEEDLNRSLQLQKEVVAYRTALLGSLHPDTLSSYSRIGLIYDAMGDHDRALLVMLDTSEKSSSILGNYDPASWRRRHRLCKLYCKLKRYTEAESHYVRLLEETKVMKGRNSLDTAFIMCEVADLHVVMSQHREAESVYLAALHILKSSKHVAKKTMQTMNNLGICYCSLGQPDDAKILLKQAMELESTAMAQGSQNFIKLRFEWVLLCLTLKRYTDAEALVQDSLEKCHQALAADVTYQMCFDRLLARSLIGQEKIQSAEILLENSIRQRENEHSQEPTFIALKFVLAEIMRDSKRYTEEEKLLEEVLRTEETVHGSSSSILDSTLGRLAKAKKRLQKFNEAEKLYNRIAEIHQTTTKQGSEKHFRALGKAILCVKESDFSEERLESLISVCDLFCKSQKSDDDDGLSLFRRFAKKCEEDAMSISACLRLELIDRHTASPGKLDRLILNDIAGLARVMLSMGWLDEAERVLECVVDMKEEAEGQSDTDMIFFCNKMYDLSRTKAALGKYDEAEKLMEEVVFCERDLFDRNSVDRFHGLAKLAPLKFRSEKWREAREFALEAIHIGKVHREEAESNLGELEDILQVVDGKLAELSLGDDSRCFNPIVGA